MIEIAGIPLYAPLLLVPLAGMGACAVAFTYALWRWAGWRGGRLRLAGVSGFEVLLALAMAAFYFAERTGGGGGEAAMGDAFFLLFLMVLLAASLLVVVPAVLISAGRLEARTAPKAEAQ